MTLGRAPRIACVDLDTFFVSVERLLDPSLVGNPVIVGAGPGQRGVVLAASYEVRRFGVHSGMSMTEARKLAPGAQCIAPRQEYSKYSQTVKSILERHCPVVQVASIDEFLLDFHGCTSLYAEKRESSGDHTLVRVLREIRETIFRETGLPVSAGVGCTRTVAKIASGLAKPNRRSILPGQEQWGHGVLLVPAGHERAQLGQLPLRHFPGLGPKAERRLSGLGLETLGQLLALPQRFRFGELVGWIQRVERAFDAETPSLGRDRPAFREHDPVGVAIGSISNERTFARDLTERAALRDAVLGLVERVCWRARSRRLKAGTVTLKLRYRDFTTIQRSRSGSPTAQDSVVFAVVAELLDAVRQRPQGVRLLGVGLSRLQAEEVQLSLPLAGERPRADAALDSVRSRYGFGAIRLGASTGQTTPRKT